MARIAVYITGHFRNFNETWPRYKALFKQTPCDIYIALWDVRNSSDPTPVTVEDIRAVCPDATHIQVLPSAHPPACHGHTTAVAGQFYGLHAIFKVLPSTYEWYVRLRTDLYFFETDLLSYPSPRADLWIPEKVWHTEPNYPARDVFNDYVWIGSYAISAYLADTYTALPELRPTYMEELFARRLRAYPHPLRIGTFPGTIALDRRTRGEDLFLPESHELTRRRQQQLPAFYINLDHEVDEFILTRLALPLWHYFTGRRPSCRNARGLYQSGSPDGSSGGD